MTVVSGRSGLAYFGGRSLQGRGGRQANLCCLPRSTARSAINTPSCQLDPFKGLGKIAILATLLWSIQVSMPSPRSRSASARTRSWCSAES